MAEGKGSRWFVRRERRRPWAQRLLGRDDPGGGVPIRARPAAIRLTEGYGYRLDLREHMRRLPEGDDTWGWMVVELPFDGRDFLNYNARQDASAHQRRYGRAGGLRSHFGFLAIGTDRHGVLRQALAARRPLEPGDTWRLEARLLDDDVPDVESRIENGYVWQERVAYAPKQLSPLPFGLKLRFTEDVAVSAEPPGLDEDVPFPTGSREGSVAVVGRLEVNIPTPKGAATTDPKVTLQTLAFDWPFPSHVGRFRFKAIGATSKNLRFDARRQRVQVEGVPVLLQRAGDRLKGALPFALEILDGSELSAQSSLKGELQLRVADHTLSEIRLQWFDATGRPQPSAGVVQYESTITANFEFHLTSAEPQPFLMERRWVWQINPQAGLELGTLKGVLDEMGFEVERAPLTAEREVDALWRARRQVAGNPLRLDLRASVLRRARVIRGEPHSLVLQMNAYYDGPHKAVADVVRQLEASLTKRLSLYAVAGHP